ncbi:ankyrin repeat domain-containing protein [Salinisphaera sp. G21_0]|uniref:ankyrin repeat domain-containing protein n=1 Tax=Salinisphaera sp. G21_0 TaxID=2821094 RepID=UPI001ADADBF5|nr:ankyrin repeat domain-containing protein [Salinisphaera sp. G21_0]MBO9480334.1 ankyrin repeat domain-containing protein [Salinisphaera sp. G21_0]
MNTVTPEDLTAFKSVLPFPVVVCHHLSMQSGNAGEFNGQSVVCQNPTTQLIRSSLCQCNMLFRDNADIQELDTLLQNRVIDIYAKQVRSICQTSVYGPHDTVYWYSPLSVRDPNILKKLQWYLSQGGVDINQPINFAGETLMHQFCKASCILRRNSLNRSQYPVHPDIVVIWLLSHGASLTTDRLGNTPLHTACSAGATRELMAILLKKVRENPEILDALNNNDETALSNALSSTSWNAMAVLLLRAGASTGDVDNRAQYIPMTTMIKDRRLDSEKLGLLAIHGLDISNCISEASLFVSKMIPRYFRSDVQVLLYWIKEGLALNGVDSDGQSLLWVCFSTFEEDEEDEEDSGFSWKLELCSYVLKVAYKYHFPENIDALKGAISDTLMETREEDIGRLLKDYPDVFYLIDDTVEMIASYLSEHNRVKLGDLLAQARAEHPVGMSLRPFIYLPYEPVMESCTDAFMKRMEAMFFASTSDFIRVGLEPDRRRFTRTESDDGIESDIEDSDEDEDSQDNPSINYSHIRLYDWLLEHRLGSLRQLLLSHKELHKTICKHQQELACELSVENEQRLKRLLGETGSVDEFR